MGLLQKACETYDTFQYLAGVEYQDKVTLAPLGYITTRADIEITLDQDGHFLSARAVEKTEPKIVIPVTEDSAGRTSAACAHPLCDQLAYLAPCVEKKHTLYVEQLADWAASPYTHPQLQPVLTYIQGETILDDLVRAGVITLDEKGYPKNEKALVRWVILGLDAADSGPCWTNRGLMESFSQYYASRKEGWTQNLCMISGDWDVLAKQHIKGIIPANGNAKLISANDSSGFTYRGRFDESWQAATVGYTASQKAHNALRWLADNQGVTMGGRTFLCWNPQGKPVPAPTNAMTRPDRRNQPSAKNPTEYQKQLRETLSGWQTDLPENAGVVIAAFDAATTGRLALTYYNELLASDFLQRLYDWDASCCWVNGIFGIQSPALYWLVTCAFGNYRENKWVVDDRILKQQVQRLVSCRVDRAIFPVDIERLLVQRASNLQLLPREERQRLLFLTCAAIRKYHFDTTKEEYGMSLDKNETDRSYLFGRLLAIAEAVEWSTYDDKDKESRQPNAIRLQSIFVQQPMHTWVVLEERLRPYYQKLPSRLRAYYKNQVDEIMDNFSLHDENLNRKLEDTYVLGYHNQRAYRKPKEEANEPTAEVTAEEQ
ncbi:MAG: type I-C CRISPR-associated protein Cas8c/Csd1 [Oscillospiraceae bacterium]|nr:type I-C CRISPR-associated protein Cas8c/Csd1 [Oscillospiraceae bacterium]